MKDTRVNLSIDDIPKRWYNLAADLPVPVPPPLNPLTKEPAKPEDLSAIFPPSIIKQEMSSERYIDIPEEVRENYILINRPSPLQRARRLEEKLKTPAKIYFKREDLSPVGSHKANSALAQAYYNMKDGFSNLTTETGAGQWGSALALACSIFDLNCTVFMVRISYEQKPYRRTVMETYGSKVYSSPSTVTEYGRKILLEHPDTPGSLGIAISEAIELAAQDPDTNYSLGSVLNHVMLHQTVIGQEVMKQLEMIDVVPDYMVGCVGGGSNFAGFSFPMIGEKLKGKNETKFIAVEPKATPSMTKGRYEYDYGDSAGMTPLLKMFTLGHDFIPSPIHAGGLRYHGMAPLVSLAAELDLVQPVAYDQLDTFEAGVLFAQSEGIIPAPESTHAIMGAIDLALKAKEANEERTIVFNLSGHGLLDLSGYEKYLNGTIESSSKDN
ncbi:MAG: tryptophan synthase beta chain [Candidatus Methanomethylophilaceae archaeon]|nr:tryptophan synthase beta chain [Candidatus Methanomethylophilaceae archaeon]MDI3541849.1 tryptophan synthase beta chain [Candidatus Methanomethylophilaceae archaeon]